MGNLDNMTRLDKNHQRGKSEKPGKSGRTAPPKFVIWGTIASVWVLLVIASYALANHYINGIVHRQQQTQENLAAIQQENHDNIAELNKNIADVKKQLQTTMDEHKQQLTDLNAQLASVQDELAQVKEVLSLAGDSLSSADKTKQTLSERINELNVKLGQLQQSIKKLEDAARVY